MEWNEVTIKGLAGAISIIIAALASSQVVGAVLKILDWWRVGKERRLEQQIFDDELNEKGHKFIIRRLDKKITEYERRLDDAAKIAIRLAEVTVERDTLRRRVTYLESERRRRGHDSTETEQAPTQEEIRKQPEPEGQG